MPAASSALRRRLLLVIGLGDVLVSCAATPSAPPGEASRALPTTTPVASASSPPAAPVAPLPPASAEPRETTVALPSHPCGHPPSTAVAPASSRPPEPINPPEGFDLRRGGDCHAGPAFCRPPSPQALPEHYPAPYERCPVGAIRRGAGSPIFSAEETTIARRSQPDVCCYYERVEQHTRGRPLVSAGALVVAPLVGRRWEQPVSVVEQTSEP